MFLADVGRRPWGCAAADGGTEEEEMVEVQEDEATGEARDFMVTETETATTAATETEAGALTTNE